MAEFAKAAAEMKRICRRLGDENDALRARVAKLEKGEHT